MRLLRSFSVYAVVLFFNAAASFFLYSFLTHKLTPHDYGIINIYTALVSLLVPVVSAGIGVLLPVEYFKMPPAAFGGYFGKAMMIPVVLCGVLTLVAVAGHSYISEATGLSSFFVAGLPALCFFNFLYELGLVMARNNTHQLVFAALSLTKNGLEIGLTVLFVVVAQWAWEGRLASNMITLLAVGCAIAFYFKSLRLAPPEYDRRHIADVLRYSLPFVPDRLAIFALHLSDRFLIRHFYNSEYVGIYSAGAQIATIMSLFILTLTNTLHPVLYRLLSAEAWDAARIRKIIFWFIASCFVIAVVTIIAIPFVFRFFIGEAFAQSGKYAVLLTAGGFLWSIYNVFIVFLLHQRRSRTIMVISLASIVLSISTNIVLLPRIGLYGAACANLLVNAFMAAASVWVTHKKYNLRRLFFGAG